MNPMNPLHRKAKLAALGALLGQTTGEIQPLSALQQLHAQEQAQMRVPGTTERGLKESQTKKLRNMMKIK